MPMFDNMKNFEARAFLCLVLAATALFIWLLSPFLDVLLWAVVIAAVFTPLYRRLLHKGLGKNLAALATMLLSLFVIILPLAWILYTGAREALLLYTQISENPAVLQNILGRLHAAFPQVQDLLANFGYDLTSLTSDLSALAVKAGGFVAKYTMVFGGGAANFVTNLAICLYVAYFLVRDGGRLVVLLVHALPFGDDREVLLMSKFAGVMRATIKGSLLVAMAQGALGGIIFWILDIRAAVLWGVAMAILSLIPVVGAALVWLPTALYLLATGDITHGIVLILYGAFVIGLADNILRPLLVGRDTKMPDYLILLSTLGGFAIFGMDGFVTGPLIAAFFITVWQIFAEETAGPMPQPEAGGFRLRFERPAEAHANDETRASRPADAHKDGRDIPETTPDMGQDGEDEAAREARKHKSHARFRQIVGLFERLGKKRKRESS